MGRLANRLSLGKEQSEALVDNAYRLFLVAGVLAPLLKASKKERVRSLRSAEALALSALTAQGLKQVIPSRRPDSLQQNSFPSSHAMNAVALAAVASAFDKKQAPLWYGGATLLGLSRLLLRRHRVRDVLAGSLLGYGLARWDLARHRGILPALAVRLNKFLAPSPASSPQDATTIVGSQKRGPEPNKATEKHNDLQ